MRCASTRSPTRPMSGWLLLQLLREQGRDRRRGRRGRGLRARRRDRRRHIRLDDAAEVMAVAHRTIIDRAAAEPTLGWLLVRLELSHDVVSTALGPTRCAICSAGSQTAASTRATSSRRSRPRRRPPGRRARRSPWRAGDEPAVAHATVALQLLGSRRMRRARSHGARYRAPSVCSDQRRSTTRNRVTTAGSSSATSKCGRPSSSRNSALVQNASCAARHSATDVKPSPRRGPSADRPHRRSPRRRARPR